MRGRICADTKDAKMVLRARRGILGTVSISLETGFMRSACVNISKIKIVPVRQAFRHEARDFTAWLEQNIDALSDRLGFRLTVLEREKAVGSFSVDLLCEDENGDLVIVENQLEAADHSHLGQLLTYMVNLDAKTAIWIATDAKTEHERVIDWLNETTAADVSFYFIRVEAVQVDDSNYAPLFTVVAQPDRQTRQVGEQKKEFAETHELRRQFWSCLLQRSQGRTTLGAGLSPTREQWMELSTGRSGVSITYQLLKTGAVIDLYIATPNQETNKHIFDQLYADKEAIEAEIGQALDWRRLDDKTASRVRWALPDIGSWRQQNRWDDMQDHMINAMIRFYPAFQKRISRIPR